MALESSKDSTASPNSKRQKLAGAEASKETGKDSAAKGDRSAPKFASLDALTKVNRKVDKLGDSLLEHMKEMENRLAARMMPIGAGAATSQGDQILGSGLDDPLPIPLTLADGGGSAALSVPYELSGGSSSFSTSQSVLCSATMPTAAVTSPMFAATFPSMGTNLPNISGHFNLLPGASGLQQYANSGEILLGSVPAQSALPPLVALNTNLISIPVPEKAQQKILGGQYIDFAELLTAPYFQNLNENLTFTATSTGFALTPQEPPKKKTPLTEREWHKAFYAFQHIHVKRWPQEASELIGYGYLINNMMQQNVNWRWYDTNFRYERASQPVKLRWDHLHVANYARAQTLRPLASISGELDYQARTPFRAGPQQGLSGGVPPGYCYNFHQEKTRCTDTRSCTFKHMCPTCGKSHPLYMHGKFEARDRRIASESSSNRGKKHNRFDRKGSSARS